ncbi:MAG: hypothetical protein ACLP6G_06915 [Terriglobales bacterium]
MACLVLLVAGPAPAQRAGVATVSFSCEFPGSNPSHYGFSVTVNRFTSYISDGKLNTTKDSGPDDAAPTDEGPFRMDFTLSQATTAHIFELAKAAQYFQGNIDSKKKNIASTGDKTLIYRDAERSGIANYNYSAIPAVQEITKLFQELSAAVEFGRRLDYEYRYQKLALDEELMRMEDTTTLQDIGPDLPAAAPALQKIADDPAVINTARERAQRLLQHAGAAGK